MPLSWLITHAEIVLLSFLVLAAATVLLQQRRTPQSTASWLLFLILAPYFAIPIFIGLGFRKHDHGPGRLVFRTISEGYAVDSFDGTLRAYGLPAAAGGHDFALLTDPRDARTSLMDMVSGATDRIDALFYIVANDTIGRDFVAALTAKVQQGVRVRLIIDRLGTLLPPRRALRQFQAAGGEVHYFSPFVKRPWQSHLNLRNHRKMLIVDDRIVFGGGMNVGHDYLGDGPAIWNDLAFTLRGPAVTSFIDVFNSDWSATGGDGRDTSPLHQPNAGATVAQLVPAGPDLSHDGLHDGLVNAIHRASDRVWIVTPYFLPTDTLAEALSVAARRGIDVRVMLPRRSNQRIADFARGAYLRELQGAGAKILQFGPGMLHAKAGVIDGTAYVGSANFDVRSMLLNFEDALILHDPASVATVSDWIRSQEACCGTGIADAGALRRIGEGLFRIGAPML